MMLIAPGGAPQRSGKNVGAAFVVDDYAAMEMTGKIALRRAATGTGQMERS
jgi:hypothetical protein